MAKESRRKRRQNAAERKRGIEQQATTLQARRGRRAERQASTRRSERPESWFQRQGGGTQTLIVLGAIAAVVAGHFALWGAVFPALGELVGRVPVVSTVTGWLFGGGAFVAWGVLAINRATAKPATVTRLQVVAWVWTVVALMCVPTRYANRVSLPVDFWAGAYASAYGVIATPLAAGVIALGWWLLVNKLAGHKADPTEQAVGWICVGYATLLLVWGSTLLRL